MAKVSLESSVLASADYDGTTQLLTLEFVSGKTYQYAKVPPSVYAQLLTAKSAGKFYGTDIRKQYKAPDEEPHG